MEDAQMYGPAEVDPVVKYYDVSFAISSEVESGWYLARAKEFGDPVLDLACGTGRLAILLAREGLTVTGLDQSAGMLDIFRYKLGAEPAAVQRRIRIEQGSMADFTLDERYRTILCCDAFFHNLTVEDEMGCLASVRSHLRPDGRFLFNLPNPSCEFILAAERSAGEEYAERGRYPLEDGGTLVVEQAQQGCAAEQTITTRLRVTRLDADGRVVEQSASSWTSRYLWRYEAVHLLYRCGFEVEALVGDYRDGPVTSGSQLVFQVRPLAGWSAPSDRVRGG